jgi:hypothetical protein
VDKISCDGEKFRTAHWSRIDELLTFRSRQVIFQKHVVTRLRASFRASRIEPRCLLISSEFISSSTCAQLPDVAVAYDVIVTGYDRYGDETVRPCFL